MRHAADRPYGLEELLLLARQNVAREDDAALVRSHCDRPRMRHPAAELRSHPLDENFVGRRAAAQAPRAGGDALRAVTQVLGSGVGELAAFMHAVHHLVAHERAAAAA